LDWTARTTPTAAWALLRQQRKRLDALKPKAPAPAGADPLELAREALALLASVRQSVGTSSRALTRVEAVEELVKKLAWGPDE
jgi:hypothetical protein